MIYCFDLDGTICTSVENSDYESAVPDNSRINKINALYDAGNKIIIMTARGSFSKKDHTKLTTIQLREWGVKYHELIMNKKPNADYYIDDKAVNVVDWDHQKIFATGVLAGSFDLIHPGYIRMFKEAKNYCNQLVVLLHEDPSLENSKKFPVHSVEERIEILSAIKYIDDVVTYKTEWGLKNFLDFYRPDVRFLGSDYKDKEYTGKLLDIPIVWIDRSHGYSTTKLKDLIKCQQ